MKSIIVALLLTIPFSAKAASPLENYLAARDGHIAKFTAVEDSGKFTDRTWRDVQRALQDLEKQLRGIIGPTVIKGFSTNGKINIDTLVRSDVGFGKLDALVYTSQAGAKDKKSRAKGRRRSAHNGHLLHICDQRGCGRRQICGAPYCEASERKIRLCDA